MADLIRFPDPHPENVKAVLQRIGDHDLVLDVGGWWKPFTRADHVVDVLPYETRGGGGRIGDDPERFSEDTWHRLDICDQQLPFPDQHFDFVYCGQTLEDVRDPIHVCRELVRVAPRGYVEVPSLWIECVFDVDVGPLTPRYPGYEKHRWLVMAEGHRLTFIPKQVWLCLLEFVPRDIADRYRHDQRIWTTPVHWERELHAEELIFSGQEQIIPLQQNYFARFDYGPYTPDDID